MRVLVIEDEERVAGFIVRGLQAEGYACDIAPDGLTGAQLALAEDYDVVLLDRRLPGMEGMDVLRTIKAKKPGLKVLMLTALDAIEDRVAGLRGGADDYLGKPFDFEELHARVEALTRRAPGDDDEAEADGLLRLHGITLDEHGREVRRDDEPIELTRLEFDLLRLFMQQAGKVLSRERILSRVWGSSEDPQTNVVDVYVRRLRVKIDRGDDALIETVRGIGYRFRAP